MSKPLQIENILHTKDGRKMGNGIIISVDSHEQLGTVYTIETDFGNRAGLTRREIERVFFITGDKQSLRV